VHTLARRQQIHGPIFRWGEWSKSHRPIPCESGAAGRVLLLQLVQRGPLGSVAFVVERSAIWRTLGLLHRGLHDGLPVR
jgi:hypothetical protein